MSKRIVSRKLFMTVLWALAINMIMTMTVYAGGNKKMEYMYDVQNVMEIKPQIYKMDASSRLSLFEAPFDNAVGTNQYINALTVISFPQGKMDMKHYFRRSVDSIEASGIYLPLINDRLVGFGQMRRFLLFDFKWEKVHKYRIAFSIDAKILNIAVADSEKKKFIFETQTYTSQSSANFDKAYYLKLADLSGDEVKVIKQVPMWKNGSTWVKAYDRVFEWGFDDKIMKVYDLNLEPSQHPLADAILKNGSKADFMRLIPHPSYSFAILIGGKKGVSSIIWSEGRDKSLIMILDDATQVAFSPDGKWLTFRYYVNSRLERTYLMPVSEKYPNFLGTPILLHEGFFEKVNCAWTRNPASFVGNDRRNLYRWELTKEAQKSIMGNDYDKYPTFHDYIVAKDLEKLTKEKKQGLGK